MSKIINKFHRKHKFIQENRLVFFISIFLVLFLIWGIFLHVHKMDFISEKRTDAKHKVNNYAKSMEANITHHLTLLNGLHAFVKSHLERKNEIYEISFISYASSLYHQENGIQYFSLAPNGSHTFIYPHTMENELIGRNMFSESCTKSPKELQQARENHQIIRCNLHGSLDTGLNLVAQKSVMHGGEFWGIICISIDFVPLLEETGIKNNPNSLLFALKDESGKIIFGTNEVYKKNPVVQTINLPDTNWKIAMIPKNGWDSTINPNFTMFCTTSFVILLLISWITYLLLSQQLNLKTEVRFLTSDLRNKNRELSIQNEKIIHQNKKMQTFHNRILLHLKKARQIQQRFLPDKLPEIEEMKFASYYQAAEEIGGDFYNVLKIDNYLLIYLTDVMGHGFDGAMLSIFIRETINSYLLFHNKKEPLSPHKVLDFLTEQYYQENFPLDYLVSIFLGVLDLQTLNLTYSSAGYHVEPLVIMGDGQIINLDTKMLPLSTAIDRELMTFEENQFQFTPGTTIFFTTDGLIEENDGNQNYGLNRLREILSQTHLIHPELIKKRIKIDFQEFLQQASSKDDITYLIIQQPYPKNKEWDLQLESTLDSLESLETAFYLFLGDIPVDPDPLYMGFFEMIVNAIKHGNKFDPAKTVQVYAYITEKLLHIEITDAGSGFDCQSKLKKEWDFTNFKENGRGLLIAKESFDLILYNKQGNKVYLLKNLA